MPRFHPVAERGDTGVDVGEQDPVLGHQFRREEEGVALARLHRDVSPSLRTSGVVHDPAANRKGSAG